MILADIAHASLFFVDYNPSIRIPGNPTWLRNPHATLDRAVWDAYGWLEDEVPAEVEEDVVLSRLLALNLERAASKEEATDDR